MELISDASQKGLRAATTQVMAGLIDIATALGLDIQTCSIHLREQAPDISTVRQIIDRLLRDAKDIGCLAEKLQRLMPSEVDARSHKFCSATTAPQLSSFYDYRSHEIGDMYRDTC